MKTFLNKHLIVSALALSSMAACGKDADPFAGALPSDDNVSIRVPGSSSNDTGQPLLGANSEFYVHTYRISRFLNAHVVGLLKTIRDITRNEPTSEEGNTRIWGPHTPGGLEPLTYRLVVEKLGENVFALDLQGRPRRSTDDADFKSLIDGQITGSGQQDGRAKGDLVLHFDTASSLNPAVPERGEIQINFDAIAQPRTVAVDFVQFSGADEGAPADATYRYSENEDSSGDFLFAIHANIHKAEENRPGLETMALRSRWVASGAGRGDVTITGEEVAAQLTEAGIAAASVQATECWGEDFNVSFQDTNPAELRESIHPLQGDAASCAVTTADYPSAI